MRFLWYPQNNQGRGGGLQPKPKAEDDNPYWELITLDITKTESNNCFIIHQGHVKVTGNHVVYDRDAWFVRVIMSSSLALFFLPSVKKHKQVLFRSMYNKTIIRFGFCDIQNNQGLGKGYHKNLIQ